MSDSIKVAIKIRPLIKREKDDNLPVQWEVQDKTIFSVDPETKRRGEHFHIFDHIFGMDKNNSDIFDAIVKPIVEATVNGFNGTIFAYGQTGSGKTHTMMGTPEEPGIIPLAIENMFDVIANTSGREFLLRVSYLEIYNEKVNDLLHKNGVDLKIHEDINGQVLVKCKEEVTNCPQNVLSIMKKGDKHRRIGETNMNERSSRSHTIFRITIESREASSDADGAIQVSQLNLVDLAGSERARQTGATGDRFKEGRHINLSLSSLSLVIMQLSESKEHVNFRDSKLTRILQASLGGNAMTTIICAVTPAALEETQCTLAFASRAKSIKNKPQINEVMSDAALLKRYSKQIAKLSAELEQERQTNRCAEVEKMESKLQEKDEYIQAIKDRMELLKTRIVSAANSVENVDFKTKSRRRRTWGGPSISGMHNQSMLLPTIQEVASTENIPATLKSTQFKKRRSIIHAPLNEINETLEFQTAVEDFELELMESERNWEMGRFSSDSVDLEDNYYVAKRKQGGNRIKFHDDVCVYPISYNESYINSPAKSEQLTPPRRSEENDSGTPKAVLRERITHLVDEYTTLQEFTTLEKQLYTKQKPEENDSDNMEAALNHMRKSVADSEMLCLETNKKYSDLQDKYFALDLKFETIVQENETLKKQLEKFNRMEENLRLIEVEKNQLKADMETKLQRLKKLEEERNDYEFQTELLETKYKLRQKELENSLEIAWKDAGACKAEKLAEMNTESISITMNNKNELPSRLKEIDEYKSEISSLSNEIVKKSDEIVRLNNKVTEVNNHNENLLVKLNAMCEELDKKNSAKTDLCNGTEAVLLLELDSTLQLIKQKTEESCAGGTELVNKILNDDKEGQESEEINASAEVERNSLSTSTVESGNERISGMKVTLERLTLENENLAKENARLKSKTELLIEEMKGLKIIGEKIHEITRELEDSLAAKTSLEKDVAIRELKLQEVQNEIKKLRDQVIGMQSEKTLWEGEKFAMQKMIDENAVIVQQIPKLEAKIEDLELVNKEFERTTLELRTSLNTKCLELESIDKQKYESEIQNLRNYVANLDQFNKDIQQENEDLKNQLQNQSLTVENDLDDLRERITEQEKITQRLEEDKKKLLERTMELSKIKSEQVVSVAAEPPSEPDYGEDKLSPDAKEDSSIFANYISFDEMDVSVVGEDSTLLDESADKTSLMRNYDKSVTVAMLKRMILELENYKKIFENTNVKSIAELSAEEDAIKLSSNEVINRLYDLMDVRTSLEDEKTKLAAELRLKIQESDEIKNDVQGLRLGIEKLEQTIHLLTTENMEMSNKLTVEKDRAKEAVAAYQEKIEDLNRRVSEITEEKLSLAKKFETCQEHLDTIRATTPTGTEDEVRVKIEEYQEKIDLLTTENINLSTELMEKIEEIDKIKETSKSSPNDQSHGCSCKDQIQTLTDELESLRKENIELSNELMEKIEESDSLKHAYELIENKLAVSVRNQLSTSVNAVQNELIELRAQNCQLQSENSLLEANKVTTLTNESTKLSCDLSEAVAGLENRFTVDKKLLNESLNMSKNSENSSPADSNLTNDGDVQLLKNKVEAYRLQVNQLTRLNKKLSDLKLNSCSQCNHLKELNDSRRTLKLEVRSLNEKLDDLQKKFEQKCADTDILRSKAREELNSSAIGDVTLNGSISEGMNVSYVEEKVQSLNSELLALKQNHEKLSALYRNKCSEIDKLNESNLLEESVSQNEPEPPTANNNRARIERVQGDIDKLREEIQQLKKRNTALSQSLEKFINEKSNLQTEIKTLKESKDELNMKLKNSEAKVEQASEKVRLLENEVTDLNRVVESLRAIERTAENEKLKFEEELKVFKAEKIANQKVLEELQSLLESERDNNTILQKELKTLITQTAESVKKDDVTTEGVKTASSYSLEEKPILRENSGCPKLDGKTTDVEKFQKTIEELKYEMVKLTEENASLVGQLNIMQQSSVTLKSELSSDSSKLEKELKTAKAYISKEIRSLKPKIETSTMSNKTVNELLVDFLKIIMQKEKEIIKTVQENFEQEKQTLEDAKRQSVNAERRVTAWAKELETDIEKLQSDLSRQEKQNVKLKVEIDRLENDLKESNHEKQLLKEKIEALESDFNALQAELAKQSDVDDKQGKEAYAMQERERIALAFAKNREIELQNSIKFTKDQHNKEVEELTYLLEQYKSKNLELKNNLEGLEANELQMKSIVDLKSVDLAKLQQRTSVLEIENTQISETCNQLNEENRKKSERIEEITNLLKIKCDTLSEYKTKLESIVPEYDILKEQINERKHYAEKYKNEYETFRERAEKEFDIMKDKLSDEQIKSSSLNEQLAEWNGKNKLLSSEIEELKSRCEELEKSNEKLVKKMRNSTTNSRVEAQIEDLKDQNTVLRKNVEGASNRITELQESKNSVTKDLISLQGRYEMLAEEKKELEKVVLSSKTRLNSFNSRLKELQDKLEIQIQEKNKIALELEATKLAVSQKEKQLATAQEKVEELQLVNKELNEELDDQARTIEGEFSTNAKLQCEIFDLKDELERKLENLATSQKKIEELELANKELNEELDDQARKIEDEIATNAKLQCEIIDLKNDSERKPENSIDKQRNEYQSTKSSVHTTEVEIIIGQNKELHEKIKTISREIASLQKENAELKANITNLESKRESRSCNSSRSSSPLIEDNRRKQRRSDLYNRGRSLEEASNALPADCRCSSLSQKVRELELEIVSGNGKIATLEMQIQSENFPYEKKCKDLERNLLAFKNKNAVLKEKVKSMQEAMSSTIAGKCEICRNRQTIKRDQSTQYIPEHKTFMSGTSSGIIEEAAKIDKLEKDKAQMREVCRARTREIRKLEKKVSEYESLLSEKSKNNNTVPIEEINQHMSNENIKSLTNREKSQTVGKSTKRAMKENLPSNILDSASTIPYHRVRGPWSDYL